MPSAQFARATRENTKAANQIMDPFFDESANELSSIEQSNAPVAAEAYEEAELGFNPYE